MVKYILKGELYHHGIPGQKWGVRNGPPYPLSQATHTKVLRTAYTRDREQLEQNTLKKSKNIGMRQAAYSVMDQQLKEVATISGGVVNVAEGIQNGQLSNLYRLDKGISEDKIKGVNPHYGERGTTSNCTKCSAAMEMRRRGWDVQAGKCFTGGSEEAIVYWFDGVVRRSTSGSIDFSKLVSETLGNNGTGAITLKNKRGLGGHCVYCYSDGDGFHIADAQIGRVFSGYNKQKYKEIEDVVVQIVPGFGFREFSAYSALKDYADAGSFDLDQTMSICRLDTATPNYKHMAEDMVLGPPDDKAHHRF